LRKANGVPRLRGRRHWPDSPAWFELAKGARMSDDIYDDDDGQEAAPMEMLASYFAAHDWPHEMVGEDEIVATAQGSWTTYELRAVWRADDGVIQLLAFPDIRVVEDKRAAAHEALALINEQLWLGHFELWSNSGTILFRHGMLLGADASMPLELTETLIESAIDECERFYPVFQFVLWGGKSPAEALAASLIETRGEA